ncbi:tryptophan 7-halogenase [Shewanella sp. WXL01]|uniref:tryptophan 7-halogenase n=1 Tax=Shewanella sp. WXL01 TaxID=2709721 RepID=UPI0014383141|nr:tryptophan 7-halogenase [Shewanella sp. WXL01]
MQISKVAIIGGGTAGWLAANHLGLALAGRGIQLTLIESPDIPTIGVGEGTVPSIRQTLKRFGIRETEFIRSCDVSFKQSIKFQNWLNKQLHGEGNFYHHLFDNPFRFGEQHSKAWYQDWQSSQTDSAYAQTVSPQFAACEANLAPKQITTPEYESVCGYAYHLNAAKFAQLLSDNAKGKFNVEHVKANVLDAKLHANGAIKSLILDKHSAQPEREFDFYIDCSGFESILHAKVLKSDFVDKSSQLFVNQALVAQVPTDESKALPPYTLATAHQAGWIWDIALPSRRGCGLVFSDNYISSEQAQDKFAKYLGAAAAQASIRQIPMKVGYRKQFWQQNCVALGLAQGFLEPIEATSILLTDFSADYLAKRFPSSTEQISLFRERFNHTMTYAWERVVEFAKLHYCLSDRIDSQFWIDNRTAESIPDGLKQRLALWQTAMPITDDFFSRFEVFNLDNYLYVLNGMKFKGDFVAASSQSNKSAGKGNPAIESMANQLLAELPEHRDLINKIHQFGLQTV